MKKALKSVVALVFCFVLLSSTAVFSSAIGAVSGENVTKTGLMAAAIAGGVFCIVAIGVFCLYKEKEVLTAIKDAKKEN